MSLRIVLPVLLLLFATATCLWRIEDKSVDFDERYTLNITTGLGGETHGTRTFGAFPQKPLPGKTFTSADYWQRFTYANTVNTALSDNGQGLPYLLLVHGWFEAVPVTVFNARIPAAVFLLLAGGLLWVFLRRNHLTAVAALLATAFLLFNGLLLDLARYIRFYTLGTLLVVISGMALYQVVQRKRAADAFLLGGIWGLLFLNQYFAALVILGQGAYLLFYERKHLKLPVWGAGLSGILILLLVWLFPLNGMEAMASVFRYHAQSAQDKSAWSPPLTFSQAFTGLAANLATVFGAATNSQPGLKTMLNIALAFPGWVLCMRLLKQPLPQFQKFCVRVAALVLAAQVAFVVGHLLMTGKGLLLVPRYWIFCIPFCAVWLALAITHAFGADRFWRVLACISLMALGVRMGLSVTSAWSGKGVTGAGKFQCLVAAPTPDIEGMATGIRRQWQPGDTVVYANWKYAQYINWFLRDWPQVVQQVAAGSQTDFARLKTPKGTVALPLRLGQPEKARPCR
jgi:hypothetical protein